MQVWSLSWQDPMKEAWQSTPVFLPGKSHGHRSLVGLQSIASQRVWHDWSDLAGCTNQILDTCLALWLSQGYTITRRRGKLEEKDQRDCPGISGENSMPREQWAYIHMTLLCHVVMSDKHFSLKEFLSNWSCLDPPDLSILHSLLPRVGHLTQEN